MGGTWRVVMLGMAVAGLALAYLANEAAQASAGDDSTGRYIALGAAAVGVVGLWFAFVRLGRHFRDLDRLSGDLLASPRHQGELSSDWHARSDELGQLAGALAELHRRDRRGGREGDRLTTVAALLEEPLLLLTDLGRITFMNPAAGRLFGAGATAGMDVYDVIERPDLFRAIERARGAGRPVSAVLRSTGGAELPVQVADLGLMNGVALVFPFHAPERPLLPVRAGAAAPMAVQPLDESEPLAALPMAALWVGVAAGRVVYMGTVRLSGARVFRTVSLDVPVSPDEPVPADALAPLDLTPAALAEARPFPGAWAVVAEALRHCVVVGVGIEAAFAVLRAEMERAGLAPTGLPPALDLGRLSAALDPASAGKDLPALAAHFGVVHHEGPAGSPHALLTAELAATLLRHLEERGVTTLGEARALSEGAAPALPPE